MRLLLQFGLGLMFGLGLLLSGMSDPAKVLNFLDLAAIATGGWDPSLALVLGGAVAVGLIGFQGVLRWRQPLLAERFYLPTLRRIDRPLLIGSAVFGIGWGLAGFCPGPALVALGGGSIDALILVAAMLAGMAAARLAPR